MIECVHPTNSKKGEAEKFYALPFCTYDSDQDLSTRLTKTKQKNLIAAFSSNNNKMLIKRNN